MKRTNFFYSINTRFIMQFVRHTLSSLFLVMSLFNNAYAQCSIGNPTTNGPAWNNNNSIEQNFNNARRWEETNRSLAPGCLGNMSAPAGGWSALTEEELALYIHNAERTCRSLLPFYGVETHLSDVSQGHSTWQINNDVFSHTGNAAYGNGSSYSVCPSGTTAGSTFVQRINSNSALNGCWETIAENIASSVAGSSSDPSFNNFTAKMLYLFMYQDAGSAWGHRVNILKVFTNNYGASDSEGFIGVGVYGGSNFQAYAYGCTNWGYAKILTIDYFDPKSTCSGFTFSTSLPVELIAFNAYPKAGEIQLEWTTASESGSNYFSVEKSADGIHFEPIGAVKAAGNSTAMQHYSFPDLAPFPGANYYRLETVELDGSSRFSPIEVVEFRQDKVADVFPNPFTEELSIRFDAREGYGSVNWLLVDLNGRIAHSGTIDEAEPGAVYSLSLPGLQAGIYQLRLRDDAGETVLKVVRM